MSTMYVLSAVLVGPRIVHCTVLDYGAAMRENSFSSTRGL